MILYDSTQRPININSSALGEGGEGKVYRVEQSNLVAKLYKSPTATHEKKLLWMLNHPPHDPTHPNHISIAWPTEILYDSSRRFVGYLMPFISNTVSLLDVYNPPSRKKSLPAGFDQRYLYRTARNLASTLEALHSSESEYVVGDLNESNIRVTPLAMVTFIDVDSFQVHARSSDGQIITLPSPVGKLEYTPRELQGSNLKDTRRKPEHDSFGLAVIIFQLLMEGNHPFRGRWLGGGEPPPVQEKIQKGYFPYAASKQHFITPPEKLALENLHPQLADLFRRCFIDGHDDPRARPTPKQWMQALRVAEDNLIQCRNGHYYPNHLKACRCGARYVKITNQTTNNRPISLKMDFLKGILEQLLIWLGILAGYAIFFTVLSGLLNGFIYRAVFPESTPTPIVIPTLTNPSALRGTPFRFSSTIISPENVKQVNLLARWDSACNKGSNIFLIKNDFLFCSKQIRLIDGSPVLSSFDYSKKGIGLSPSGDIFAVPNIYIDHIDFYAQGNERPFFSKNIGVDSRLVNVRDVIGMNFSPDGRILALWTSKSVVVVYSSIAKMLPLSDTTFRASDQFVVSPDSPKGHLLFMGTNPNGKVRTAEFSPDGQILAIQTTTDLILYKISNDKFEQLATLNNLVAADKGFTFSNDGLMLVVAEDISAGNRTRPSPRQSTIEIVLWRKSDMHLLRTIRISNDTKRFPIELYSLSLSPDANILAVGIRSLSAPSSENYQSLLLFSTENGNLLGEQNIYIGKYDSDKSIVSLYFSPDQRLLASLTRDGTVYLFGIKP